MSEIGIYKRGEFPPKTWIGLVLWEIISEIYCATNRHIFPNIIILYFFYKGIELQYNTVPVTAYLYFVHSLLLATAIVWPSNVHTKQVTNGWWGKKSTDHRIAVHYIFLFKQRRTFFFYKQWASPPQWFKNRWWLLIVRWWLVCLVDEALVHGGDSVPGSIAP